jgi:hypothetical protein
MPEEIIGSRSAGRLAQRMEHYTVQVVIRTRGATGMARRESCPGYSASAELSQPKRSEMATATANPKLEVLTPKNCQLIFIDQQPQMAFGVQSIDRQVLKNNVVALAKAAKIFKIPTTITSVESESFSGTPIRSCSTSSLTRNCSSARR